MVGVDMDLDLPTFKPGDEVGGHKLVQWLANGQFSTVWHARPAPPGTTKRRGRRRKLDCSVLEADVAIKFYTSDPLYADLAGIEARNLACANPDHHPHLQYALGSLDAAQPGLILPIAACDLHTHMDGAKGLSAKAAALCVAQVASALHHLHARGMAHGDVKPENVLVYPSPAEIYVRLTDLDSLQYTTPDALRQYGRRRAAPTTADDAATDPPDDRIRARTNPDLGVREYCVALGDGQEAYVEEPAVTLEFRAPEFIIFGEYGCPADVWALGCIFFELRTGEGLFDLEGENRDGPMQSGDEDANDDDAADADADDDERADRRHLQQMIAVLGPAPEDLGIGDIDGGAPASISARLRQRRVRDRRRVETVLEEMMTWHPADRCTADRVRSYCVETYDLAKESAVPSEPAPA